MSTEFVFALFLVPPFLLAFFHARVNKKVPGILIYYRYFMSFNMIFAALFVAVRMLLDAPSEAQLVGWDFSPMFYLYGIALLSMALMGALTVFSRHSILMAPAILWTIFLTLSILTNLVELVQHSITANNLVVVNMLYDVVTIVIMLCFLWLLRQKDWART